MQQAIERPGPEDYSPDPEKLLKVALKLLVRAGEALLAQEPPSTDPDNASMRIRLAGHHTRAAMVALAREKEEMCKP